MIMPKRVDWRCFNCSCGYNEFYVDYDSAEPEYLMLICKECGNRKKGYFKDAD